MANIANRSYLGEVEDVHRDVLKLRPGITGPATLKYRLEDEMISKYVAQKQKEGDERSMHVRIFPLDSL